MRQAQLKTELGPYFERRIVLSGARLAILYSHIEDSRTPTNDKSYTTKTQSAVWYIGIQAVSFATIPRNSVIVN